MTIRLEDESLSLVAHREEELPILHNCWTRSAIRTALTNASIYKSKTHTSAEGEVRYRLCGNAPESVAHILSGCSMLAQSKSLSRYDAVLKELFYQLLYDKGLIDEMPPWYTPA